eukprot:394864_1
MIMITINVLFATQCMWLIHGMQATAPNTTIEIYQTSTTHLSHVMCSSPNCKVICNTKRGCYNTIINASSAETLTLICSAHKSCMSLSIASGARNHTEIDCSGYSSCYAADFIIDNSSNIYLNCGNSSCNAVELNGSSSSNMNIKCSSKNACYYMRAFILNTECNLKCLGSRLSCRNMNIYVNYKSILNIDIRNNSNSSLIDYVMSIVCNGDPQRLLDASQYNTEWYCSRNGWDVIYLGTLHCNTTEPECTINCETRDCKRHLITIDGNYSGYVEALKILCGDNTCDYLTVHARNLYVLDLYCLDESSCQYAEVYCPYTLTGSCNIYCHGANGCKGMTIYGKKSNILSIHCQNKEACDSMVIYAENASYLEFNSSTYGAKNVEIYGATLMDSSISGARTIKMECMGEYACYYMDIYAIYANSIIVTAGYSFGFANCNLYAENASNVSVSCSSDVEQYGCYMNNYYLPDYGKNTNIYCYAAGCYKFGNIYVASSLSSLDLYVNQCNECKSCINTYIINCGHEVSSWYYMHDIFNGTQCVDQSDCDCFEMASNAIFENDRTDKNCIVSAYKTVSKLRYDLLYLLFLIFIPFIIFLVYWRIKYMNAYVVDKALVLMVGITKFDDEEKNLLNDERNITKLVNLWRRTYKYDVCICNEHSLYATKQNVIDFIDKYKVKMHEKLYKAVIVHIITHGFSNDNFLTSDMKEMSIKFIEHELISESEFCGNTSMIKLIFYHACRGTAVHHQGIEVEEHHDTICCCDYFGNPDKYKPDNMVQLNEPLLSEMTNSNRSGNCDGLSVGADSDMSAHSNFVIIYQTIQERVTSVSGHFTNCIHDVFVKNAAKWVKTNFIGMIREIGIKLEQITSKAEICTTFGIGTLRHDPIRFEVTK